MTKENYVKDMMKMIAMMMITITLITLAGSLPVKTKTNKILSVMNDDEENINEDYNDYNDLEYFSTAVKGTLYI